MCAHFPPLEFPPWAPKASMVRRVTQAGMVNESTLPSAVNVIVPGGQVWQAPFIHVPMHTFPHAPQLLTSLCPLISQPFANTPSQSRNPPVQEATAHAPLAHAETPLAMACSRTAARSTD